MLETAFLIALTLAVSIGGGAASVWYALETREGVGAVTIGAWTTYPDIGTPASDPYSQARVTREGFLALGRAEGLTFVAQADSNGDLLTRQCHYSVEGATPPTRFWTFYAADEAMRAVPSGSRRANALHAFDVLRLPDNSMSIAVGVRPSPGNWLQISGAGRMVFVLTLYDTPIANSTGLANIELPQVLKTGCDD